MVSTKILNGTINFNIDNNNVMKDHVTLNAEVMVAFKNILFIY